MLFYIQEVRAGVDTFTWDSLTTQLSNLTFDRKGDNYYHFYGQFLSAHDTWNMYQLKLIVLEN